MMKHPALRDAGRHGTLSFVGLAMRLSKVMVFKAFFVLLIGFLGATQAMAGQYSSTSLGKALPSWMEAVGDLNSDGDAAWTSWDGSTVMRAQAYSASKGAEVLGATNRVSQAIGVSARDGNRLWIVGVEGSNLKRLDDQAMMWEINASTGKKIVANTLNIGAATNKSAGAGTVQQSAAYGMERIGTSKEYFVVGFARDKVSNATLADPTVWVVDNSGTPAVKATKRLDGLLTGTGASGVVTDVASNTSTNKTWACGHTVQSTGGSLPYVQATCWTLARNGSTITAEGPDAQLNTDLKSSSGFGNNVVTSLIHRVRTVPLGANGELHTVAIGMAMVGTSASNYAWRGFVYDLDSGTIWKDFALASNAETMAYDAAGIEYMDGAGSSYGLDVVGVSRTASGGSNNVLAPGPTGVSTGALRGTSTRNLVAGTHTNAATTCNIDGDSAKPGSNLYDQVVAVSRDGSYRLAQDGAGNLRFLTRRVNDFDIEFFNRTTTSKLTHSTARSTNTYHQMKATFAPTAPNSARVRFGTALSCQTASGGGMGTCSDNYTAAFDIASGKDVTLNQSINSTTLRTGNLAGTFSVGSNRYVQGATRINSGNVCSVSSVQPAAAGSGTVAQKVTTGKSVGTTDTDYDGTPWTYCGATPQWVNTKNDIENCSNCGAAVQNVVCAQTSCNNGSPALGAVNANHCAIGTNNNWTCYDEDQRNPNATTTQYRLVNVRNEGCGNGYTTPNYRDPCSACDSSNPTQWSASKHAMCCSSGNARLDAYDRNQAHCNDNQFSYDRNDGRVRSARWKDPRSGWIYDQNDDWSSADLQTCYANGSGDPHSIIDPGIVNDKYARPRRIDAFFTPPIDMEDWYEAAFDDNGDGKPTPKPRARLISRKINPATNKLVKMQLCLYVDVANGSQSRVSIKDMRINAGENKTSTHNGPANSPAYDAKGQCVDTDDNGVADIVVYDYDNTKNSKEDAYVHFVVRPLDDISNLHCDQTLYTLYYGNDKRAGVSAQTGYNANKTGCVDCCN